MTRALCFTDKGSESRWFHSGDEWPFAIPHSRLYSGWCASALALGRLLPWGITAWGIMAWGIMAWGAIF